MTAWPASVIVTAEWRVGGVVTQRSAKPFTPVRTRYVPPKLYGPYGILPRMPHKRSWTDEQLILAVGRCFSVRAVIKNLGLIPAGGNYVQVRKRITELNLDITHFTGMGWNKGKRYHTLARPELELLLVADSVVQSYKLKRRLYETGLKQPKCELCGWAEVSADGRIPVELDHINGNHQDNRLENLRVLCPNCHSLQPTHRGKNKKVHLARVS